jgi:DNA-binding beta-propeller fold protein YncE
MKSWLAQLASAMLLVLLAAPGCTDTATWGRRGLTDGRLQKPRAMAIDSQDHLYIVDKTARIQVFDTDGAFLRSWQTPAHANGCPTGISITKNGDVIVPDTHYYQVLFYSPTGELKETLGGTKGNGPGEFGWVTDVTEDSHRNLYVSEYGEYDRIQKFSPEHKYLLEWGSHGAAPGQFSRPQSLAVDELDHIWVADALNNRVQVFDDAGKLLFYWGTAGTAPGQLAYPYGLALGEQGAVYLCEYENNRVQKFTREGKSLACWGKAGRGEGELYNPWALVRDHQGRIHVLDTNNHRVQTIRL